uniref:Uncharacterized protein n=1 Tax=Myotis myotis TaxID=51298 RepID=A0A7J7SRD8_MYOMY|nr:hypothetical protein mMyoMyo1_009358 [Myotis myotis]
MLLTHVLLPRKDLLQHTAAGVGVGGGRGRGRLPRRAHLGGPEAGSSPSPPTSQMCPLRTETLGTGYGNGRAPTGPRAGRRAAGNVPEAVGPLPLGARSGLPSARAAAARRGRGALPGPSSPVELRAVDVAPCDVRRTPRVLNLHLEPGRGSVSGQC